MRKHLTLKNVAQAIAIFAVGFFMLNIIFVLDFAVISLFNRLFQTRQSQPPIVSQIFFLIVLAVISVSIFRSKMITFLKAAFLMVPLATAYVIIGLSTFRWPYITYPVCALIGLGGLYFLWRNKSHWYYWFSWISISIALLIFTLAGGEI